MNDLLQLLDHVQSGSIEKKRKAAENLPRYIQKVPEMGDDVVNAVYDLCEDPAAEVSPVPAQNHVRAMTLGQVRVEGYKSIVAVSKEDQGTLKRNVDVLIQLLQCGQFRPYFRPVVQDSSTEETDDPGEIIHIREGLVQHLAIDPNVAMTVLCDQLSWTEDEHGNREQLRTLVLEFLGRTVRSLDVAIIRSSGEILVEGIINVSPLSSGSGFSPSCFGIIGPP